MKRLAALFEIFITLVSFFSAASLAPLSVDAQTSPSPQQQKVCCEETTTGEHCQYVDQNQCKPGKLQAAASCDQTSFCKLGCGFDSTSGQCFVNTPKSSCQSQNGCTWTDSSTCDIPQCQKGCCVLSNQCSFTTQIQCKQITSQYAAINMTFDESVTDEFTCINQCRSFERGACVQPDGSCLFTTRNACGAQANQITNSTGPKVGFHPNRLCSNPLLGTECAAQQYTGCVADRDEVYWFDSCGNAENIYSSDKRGSYNNGFILDKTQSCNSQNNNLNSASCGNCNFAQGTLCGKAPSSVNPAFGDYTCIDLSCNQLTVSPTSPASQTGKKQLGESWCAYDGAPGFGRDFVGSRHYRRICINGQELTEPCKDFREEVCVQGVQGQPPLPTQQSFQLAQGTYVESLCRSNRHSSCTTTTNQLDCENIQSRDCYWVGEKKQTEEEQRANTKGKCVPLVSPGLKFWPEQSVTATSILDPKATCNAGNQQCTVTFQRPGLLGNALDWKGKSKFGNRDWVCVSNCQCLEKEYLQAMNNVCKSLGDCGAWYNIKGVFTEGGFVEDSKADITVDDVEDYDSLISPVAGKSDYDSKFSAFFKQAAPGLIIIGATTVGTVIAFSSTLGYGSLGILEAAGRGFLSGFNGFFGLEATFTETTYGQIAARSFASTTAPAVPSVGATLATGSTFQAAAGTYTLPASTNVVLAQTGVAGNALPLTSYIPTTTYPPPGLGISPLPISTPATATSPPGFIVKDIGNGFIKVTVPQNGALTGAVSETGSNVVVQNGMTVTPPPPPTVGFWGQALQFLNAVAWIYTIYSLIDALLADTKTEVVTITCNPWTAPLGGSNCGACAEEGKECSEYRCRSLGQNCKLLNAGTKQEACVDSNPNDATSPIISADKTALNKGYTLTESAGQGFTVNEAIEPFTPVSLGITTNEYAQCKFSLEPTQPFDQMTNTFGKGVFDLAHSMTFSLPSILAQQDALKLTNGGKYTLYLRCQDGNGNKNNKPYYVKFSIKPGPDYTAPVIEATSIVNGAFVPAGVNTTALTIYTNEPSSCNWDDIDQDFSKMTNSFACKQSPLPTTSLYYGLYDCTTVLTNIQSNARNDYYFRCKDQSNNVNAESYVFTLQGTEPLLLTSITPTPGSQFFVPDVTLRAVTSKGALGGLAICGYSFIDNNPSNAIPFVTTNSSVHEQPFEGLLPAFYNTYVTCADVAGNIAQGQTNFTVSIDTQGPLITSISTQSTLLHISTDEASSCEFSTTGSFSYGQGTPMTGAGTTEHETTLDSSLYYIVCQDQFTNTASYKIFV